MDRVALFVDAGYLFAAGSVLIRGEKLSRAQLALDVPRAMASLEARATSVSGLPVLRTYWYDGAQGEPSPQQRQIGFFKDVKLRLGYVTSQGQKGVDSLLVTDMISLSRNRAMSAALLLTGDEDIRIGVQQAQELGVRVHLLGIEPHRTNQSVLLQQEADTVDELGRQDVEKFLSVFNPSSIDVSEDASMSLGERVAHAVWGSLDAPTQAGVRSDLAKGTGQLPTNVSALLLKTLSEKVGRVLTPDEKRSLRQAFREVASSGPGRGESERR